MPKKARRRKKRKYANSFQYSKHSLQRLAQRGIKKKEVEYAVIHAQWRRPQPSGEIIAKYTRDGEVLTVLYLPVKGNKITIITAYYED